MNRGAGAIDLESLEKIQNGNGEAETRAVGDPCHRRFATTDKATTIAEEEYFWTKFAVFPLIVFFAGAKLIGEVEISRVIAAEMTAIFSPQRPPQPRTDGRGRAALLPSFFPADQLRVIRATLFFSADHERRSNEPIE